jgi:predicted DNA-binding transcriptional regulator AlpA
MGLNVAMGDANKSPSLFSDALRSELKEILREVLREEMKTRLGNNALEERLLDTKQMVEILGVSESYLEHNAHHLPFTRRLRPKLFRFSYVAVLKCIDAKKLSRHNPQLDVQIGYHERQ